MRVPHMHDDIGLGNLFQRRAKGRDKMGRQVGDKTDGIREDCLSARWQIEAPHRRVERREQQVFSGDLRARQAIEQRRLPGIRIPDQRNDRVGNAPTRLAMQRAGTFDLIQLPAQPGNALADQPAVDFELALTRSAEKSETAALTFEMRPRPDKPRTLVRQCSKFDLQPAFMSARAGAENLKDQSGAVDNLGLPAPFKIALLHRAQRRVNDNKPDLVFRDNRAQRLDVPGAEQGCRYGASQSDGLGAHNIQIDGTRQSDRFFETGIKRALWRPRNCGSDGICRRMDNERAPRRGGYGEFGVAQNSFGSLPPSKSWIGCAGMTVEIACL